MINNVLPVESEFAAFAARCTLWLAVSAGVESDIRRWRDGIYRLEGGLGVLMDEIVFLNYCVSDAVPIWVMIRGGSHRGCCAEVRATHIRSRWSRTSSNGWAFFQLGGSTQ